MKDEKEMMAELETLWAQAVTDEIFEGPKQDGRTHEFAKRWFFYAYKGCVLAARKQADYGSDNINMTGLYGVAVRMLDKVSRLINLTKKEEDVEDHHIDEALTDTMMDLSNYGIIGQMVHSGEWGLWDR